MKKLHDILKQLLETYQLTPSMLSRATNIGQPVIFRILSGETDNPKIATLAPIAKHFGITIDQLIGHSPLPSATKKTNHSHEIPLLSWEETNYITHTVPNSKTTITTNLKATNTMLALKIQDDAMSPLFEKGTIIILDIDKTPQDRSYTLGQLKGEKKPIFRQLLIDEQRNYYLKPLNPDDTKFKIRLLKKSEACLGTLIQAIKNYEGDKT